MSSSARSSGGAGKDNHEALKRPGRFRKVRDNLEVKEDEVGEGSAERRFVVVRNPEQAKRDRAVRTALLQRLEEAIEHVNRSAKGHSKAVRALKSHPAYGRYVRELKNGRLAVDRARAKAEEKLDGQHLISTTDPTLSPEALGYKQLLEVERAFRTMKSTLDLQPPCHRLPDRIKAQVLLCWLGLLLIRVAENESGQSWEQMRDTLEEISLVKLCGRDGRAQMVTDPTDAQRKTLKNLGVKPPTRVQQIAETA